jgi:hypothetical protein
MPRRGADSSTGISAGDDHLNPLRSNEKTRRPLDLPKAIG